MSAATAARRQGRRHGRFLKLMVRSLKEKTEITPVKIFSAAWRYMWETLCITVGAICVKNSNISNKEQFVKTFPL